LVDSLLTAASDEGADMQRVMAWIKSHGADTGAAWETYSACERVANLLLYLSVRRAPALGALEGPVVRFIAQSLDWIDMYLEYYGESYTNNHIINNARALIMGGVAIGNQRAYTAGLRILRETLPDMILSGGFLRERSSHYQLIVFGWILDAWKFAALQNTADGEDARFLARHAVGMSRAAQMLCGEDGLLLATIGDVSPDATPLKSALRLAALYPEFWPAAVAPAVAPQIRDGWFRIEKHRAILLGNFPAGTHPLTHPHHGHSDHSAFALRQDGVDILIDTGRYRYTPDDISMLQTSARGHNVPLVNGFPALCETLLSGGLWWPRPYADATLKVTSHDEKVALEHDGFARATPVRRHIRELSLEDNGLLVVDTFEGNGAIDLELCWNFGSGFTTFDTERMTAGGVAGKVMLDIEGTPGAPAVEYVSGRSPGGWCSKEYGEVRASLGVMLLWRLDLPARVSTHFEFQRCAA
jgi:hypothetical protein